MGVPLLGFFILILNRTEVGGWKRRGQKNGELEWMQRDDRLRGRVARGLRLTSRIQEGKTAQNVHPGETAQK